MNRIEQAILLLESHFEKSHLPENERKYRVEHSYRVANIGKEIALAEGLDVEALTIACLLHDLSYSEPIDTDEKWLNHGRRAAEMARPLIESLGYDEKTVNNILYGIAIHVDDKADFEGERNPFTLSVMDADNIDRFHAIRLLGLFNNNNFDNLSYEEQMTFLDNQIERFTKYSEIKFATPTGTKLFQDKIQFSLDFLKRVQNQLNNSKTVKI